MSTRAAHIPATEMSSDIGMPGCPKACNPANFERLWESRAALGCLAYVCGRYGEAISLWRSIAHITCSFAPDDPRRAAAHIQQALICHRNDDPEGALENARLACAKWHDADQWQTRSDISTEERALVASGLQAAESLHDALKGRGSDRRRQDRHKPSDALAELPVTIGFKRFLAGRAAMSCEYRKLAAAHYLIPFGPLADAKQVL